MIKLAKPPDTTWVFTWRLPSPRLDPAASMFEAEDLMRRFEIDDTVREEILAASDGLQARLALYVCHAVSRSLEARG